MILLVQLVSNVYLALRVEWAKARARADRWEEEVVLLDEEMRRVLMFCEWKNRWWKDQVARRLVTLPESEENRAFVSPELAEGLRAFSEDQAAQESALALSFSGKWSAVRARARPLINRVMGIVDPGGEDVVIDDPGMVEFLMGEEDDDAGGGSDYEE